MTGLTTASVAALPSTVLDSLSSTALVAEVEPGMRLNELSITLSATCSIAAALIAHAAIVFDSA